MPILHRKDLIFPELSFIITGCAFQVHNELGYGHLEKVYQKAMRIEMKKTGLQFVEQPDWPINYDYTEIGSNRPDFVVEEKIVLDLKRSGRITPKDFDQMKRYLRAKNYKLGLLIHFGIEGVIIKRVLYLY